MYNPVTKPMLPTDTFSTYSTIQAFAQTACIATSFTQGISFFVSQGVGKFISEKFALRPFSGNKAEFRRKLAPVLGISTLVAYKLYAMSTSFVAQGLICGVHHIAMRLFSYGLVRPFSSGRDSLTMEQSSLIDSRSENIASAVLVISSVALTLILHNPILANAIAYPLASLTKIAVMKLGIRRQRKESIESLDLKYNKLIP